MKRRLAFCFGLALAWCGTAEAQSQCMAIDEHCSVLDDRHTPSTSDCIPADPTGTILACKPTDAAKVEIDDLKEQVKELRELLKALLSHFLPECSGDPPEHMPCIERREVQ